MQHLSLIPEGTPSISAGFQWMSSQVRFFALHRIKPMLHRLCGPPSIHLSFNLATVLPRRSTYRVSYPLIISNNHSSKSTSFTAWTTRVSNPVCSPRFRTSASVLIQKAAFATGVPPISTHFTATPEILHPLSYSSWPVRCNSQVEPGAFTSNLSNRLRALLRPVIPINACTSVLPRLLARS